MSAEAATALPVAQPPANTDPAAYYALFSSNIQASWSPASGLVIRLGAADPVPTLHVPLHALVRFVPSGQPLEEGGTPIVENTLVLRTWPVDFLKLGAALGEPVPALIVLGNVDRDTARDAGRKLVESAPIEIDPSAIADILDSYLEGSTKLLASASEKLGNANVDPNQPDLPRRVTVRMYDQAGSELNPLYYLQIFAELAGIDIDANPLLSLLDFASATEPSLISQLVQIEDPGSPGEYRPADYGLFATLTPRVQVTIPDGTAVGALEATITDPFNQTFDISDQFTYDTAGGAAFAILTDTVTDLGIHILSVSAPFKATLRFMLYGPDEPEVPINIVDESYVPTHVPTITRSDKLIGVEFVDGISDKQMSAILRKHHLYAVSLIRTWDYVTVVIPTGSPIFEKLSAITAEDQIDHAFIPGNARVNSNVRRGQQDTLVLILKEDFEYDESPPVG